MLAHKTRRVHSHLMHVACKIRACAQMQIRLNVLKCVVTRQQSMTEAGYNRSKKVLYWFSQLYSHPHIWHVLNSTVSTRTLQLVQLHNVPRWSNEWYFYTMNLWSYLRSRGKHWKRTLRYTAEGHSDPLFLDWMCCTNSCKYMFFKLNLPPIYECAMMPQL